MEIGVCENRSVYSVTPTPFLQVIPQRHARDCAVACLAMLAGVSYEDALMAAKSNVIRTGMETRQIRATAKRLGLALQMRRTFDLEADTGLLAVSSPQWPTDHLVVLKDGLIVDTDATIWDADVFLSAYSAKTLSLLTLV